MLELQSVRIGLGTIFNEKFDGVYQGAEQLIEIFLLIMPPKGTCFYIHKLKARVNTNDILI